MNELFQGLDQKLSLSYMAKSLEEAIMLLRDDILEIGDHLRLENARVTHSEKRELIYNEQDDDLFEGHHVYVFHVELFTCGDIEIGKIISTVDRNFVQDELFRVAYLKEIN